MYLTDQMVINAVNIDPSCFFPSSSDMHMLKDRMTVMMQTILVTHVPVLKELNLNQ